MKQSRPPKLPFKLLKWFCRPDYLIDLEGDLLELYERRVDSLGRKKANRKLTKDILLLFRPGILRGLSSKQKTNHMALLKHNLVFSFRNFRRHKSSFIINLIGLSTGLACASLIYLWAIDELKVDKFHENDDRLYQIMMNSIDGNMVSTSPHTAMPLAQALVEEFAEVETAVSVIPAELSSGYLGDFKLSTDSVEKITTAGHFAQKDFFKIFSYKLIEGRRSLVLEEPKSITISEDLAIKIFGSVGNALGKNIEWQLAGFGDQVKVSGVFENVSEKSTSQFDFVLSYDAWIRIAEKVGMNINSWDNQAPSTYVLLNKESELSQFQEHVKPFVQSKNVGTKSELMAIPYSSQYLYGNFEEGHQIAGRIKYVRLFSVIAVFILIIACINFMNLSTARASRRMKEIGIKKTLGIQRKHLVFQFLGESLIMTFLSSLLAFVLILIILPQFNLIAEKQLSLDFNLKFLFLASTVIFITGLISGSYPALYLSGFEPISVLKGKLQSSLGESWVRKGLVIFQFTVSIVLISGVLVIYKQVSFIQNKNLGYKKKHVIFFSREGRVVEREDLFLSELLEIPGVVNASSMGGSLAGLVSTTNGLKWEGKDPESKIAFANVPSNYGLIETLGIEMIDGRTFSKDFQDEKSLIFNETAIAIMGISNPIGKSVRLWGDDYKIIGVVKDFHVESLHNDIKPLFVFLDSDETFTIMVRIQSGNEQETLANIERFNNKFNPGFPPYFKFLDKNYQAIYASEKRVSALSKYFAGLAILISCLGLLGLVAFTVERRTKEIGMRKILGLSELGIIRLISGDFMKLVFASVIIALPFSYLLTRQWLDQFAYRVELEWWFFAYAGIGALFLALTIATWQVFKIARVNPSQYLKTE